jgi:hypothetical protein
LFFILFSLNALCFFERELFQTAVVLRCAVRGRRSAPGTEDRGPALALAFLDFAERHSDTKQL